MLLRSLPVLPLLCLGLVLGAQQELDVERYGEELPLDSLVILDGIFDVLDPHINLRNNLRLALRFEELARAGGRRDLAARAAVMTARSYRYLGDSEALFAALERAQELLGEQPDTPEHLEFWTETAFGYYLRNQIDSFHYGRLQYLATLRRSPFLSAPTEGEALARAAVSAAYSGQIPEAAELNEEARRIGLTQPTTDILFRTELTRATLASITGQHQLARRIMRTTLQDSTIHRTPYVLQSLIHSLALSYQEANLLDSAAFYIDLNLRTSSPEQDLPLYVNTLINLAQLYVELREWGKFTTTYQKLRAFRDAHPELRSELTDRTYQQLGAYAAARADDPDLAVRLVGESLAGFDYEAPNLINISVLDGAIDIYRMIGRYDLVYTTEEALDAYAKTIITQEHRDALVDLEVRYAALEQETALHAQQLALASSRERNWWLSGLALALLAVLAVTATVLRFRSARSRLLRRQKEQLVRLDAAKSRFFVNISHEFRTPLTLILAPLAQVQTLSRRTTVKRQAQLAYDNGQQLLTIVDEILDLSKLESGQLRVRNQAVELYAVLRRVFLSFHSAAHLRGVILSFQCHLAEDLWVHLDLDKLERILHKVIRDAIARSHSGGVVTLKATRPTPQELRLLIRDTGRALVTTAAPYHYSPKREQSPTAHERTTVGLALSSELAAVMGGELAVLDREGQGSDFVLTLPCSVAPPGLVPGDQPLLRPALANHEESPQTVEGSAPLVLVVEDNPDVLGYVVECLGEEFRCATACDGQEALELLPDYDFDLIVSDVMMPRIDGFELLELVRQDPRYAQLPFLFLTARDAPADRERGLQLGVDDYLTKPFVPAELTARIHNALRNRRRRDETVAPAKTPSSPDRTLLRLEDAIRSRLTDPQLSVTYLAQELGWSQRELTALVSQRTGLTPARLIQEVRLLEAERLLKDRRYHTVSETARAVGINSASYFSRLFTRRFGLRPSEYANAAARARFPGTPSPAAGGGAGAGEEI